MTFMAFEYRLLTNTTFGDQGFVAEVSFRADGEDPHLAEIKSIEITQADIVMSGESKMEILKGAIRRAYNLPTLQSIELVPVKEFTGFQKVPYQRAYPMTDEIPYGDDGGRYWRRGDLMYRTRLHLPAGYEADNTMPETRNQGVYCCRILGWSANIKLTSPPVDLEKLKLKIDLIKAKVEILKLRADDYNWSCHVHEDVKEELAKTLIEIERILGVLG